MITAVTGVIVGLLCAGAGIATVAGGLYRLYGTVAFRVPLAATLTLSAAVIVAATAATTLTSTGAIRRLPHRVVAELVGD